MKEEKNQFPEHKTHDDINHEDEHLSGRGDVEKMAHFQQVAMHSARRRQFRLSKMRD